MRKYTVREQGQIRRVLQEKKGNSNSKLTARDFKNYDLKMRTKFQMRYIANFELSEIMEEEGPEQACTEFDR
jgi:hypothetical protein